MVQDPTSITGKPLATDRHVQLLVVGGGPAGRAAAGEAARLGLAVMLVDEHPLDPALIGLDIPLHFGQRADGSVQNRSRALEQIVASTPEIEDLFALGVDIRLGASVWGLYANGADVRWLPGLVAGIVEENGAAMISCDRAVVATGRRDLGFAFPGWHLPGVMGAAAAAVLIERYRAFAGSRLVILGAGVEGLMLAQAALDAGLTVAAIVEVAPTPPGPVDLVDALGAAGVPIRLSAVALAAEGGAAGVSGVRIAALDEALRPVPGSETLIACDTICLALGGVPAVDALDAMGCAMTFRGDRGGHVPVLGEDLSTSIAGVYAAGDCAGLSATAFRDPEWARRQGRMAARSAAASLGAAIAATDGEAGSAPNDATDVFARRLDWMRAMLHAAGNDLVICQCEEVTRADILGLRPPRYLGVSVPAGARGVGSLAVEGAVNQDQVKRLTRVGMGVCQGRRCREQTALLLAAATGVPASAIPLPSHRPPLRPLPLSTLQALREPAGMTEHWAVWFGIPSQWRPFWDLAERRQDDAPAGYGK